MARIRSIKPEAFTSETLSSLDYFTRWTFAGLWTYFDDHGYGRADARLIRAALFPLDDDATVSKVQKAVTALEEAECLCRFEVDGRTYLHAPNWSNHQKVNRPSASKIPPCPEHDNGPTGEVLSTHAALTEDSVSAHGGLTGGKEQGTGNREHRSAPADGAFDEFWTLYPRKVSKPDAARAWTKAIKRADTAHIIAGLRAHLPAWASADQKFIPHAATWLNGDRWDDEVASADPEADRAAQLWASIPTSDEIVARRGY
jgi:hypothetical protein